MSFQSYLQRTVLVSIAIAAMSIGMVAPARATITPSSDAALLASAMSAEGGLIAGAEFVTLPPDGTPHGVSDTPMMGFPRKGSDYAILTTGNASAADRSGPFASAADGGGNVRGNSDFDVTIMRLDLDVPEGRNCLRFDFQFLSNENSGSDPLVPLYDGETVYNDAFVAELNTSDWEATDSEVTAPGTFAVDPTGNAINVNSAEMTSVRNARTKYFGASTILNAATGIAATDSNDSLPGNNSLYLSIFDQGDDIFDSAVFVDNLQVTAVENPLTDCVPGPYATLTGSPAVIEAAPGAMLHATLSAQLTDAEGAPLAGRTIEFFVVDQRPKTWSPVCSASTDANGMASCGSTIELVASEAINRGYHAIFNGDLVYPPAFATGSPVRVASRDLP